MNDFLVSLYNPLVIDNRDCEKGKYIKYDNRKIRATGVKSKKFTIEFGSNDTMTKFVDVPIKVQHPPIILANEIGIKNCDVGNFAFLVKRLMIGVISVIKGVLFKNADNIAINIHICIKLLVCDAG